MSSRNAPGGPERVRRVAFYVRVSTEGQARVQEGSLKNQEQALASELRRRNTDQKWGRLVGSYVDGGVSAKNMDRPEFKRLLADVERGAIDAIFFTELSRLSRSLRDFLHIFEFTQEHECDLVCLKTEIDTTSPFSNLVVRILMVFAEFEREMTADRIKRNAYERSKRGLAYGGFEPLGYRRDPEHKGRLLIDPDEAAIIRDIFKTYIRKRSLLQSIKALKAKHDHPRIQKLSRNGLYGILTNKVYIGIREIKTNVTTEEVSGQWKAIITNKTFEQVRDTLSGNGPGPRSPRHNYIFAGLIRCAKCGKKLQGKSGKGRSGQPRYYYAHAGRCAEGGLHSIEANDAHTLVLDWLHSIAKDRNIFGKLLTWGRKELNKQLRAIKSNLKKLDHEDAALQKRLADSTAKLSRSTGAPRRLLEKEAEELLSRIQENERQTQEAESETETLNAILDIGDRALFREYSERTKRFLRLSDRERSRRILTFIRTLALGDDALQVQLVHKNGTGRSLSDPAASLIGERIRLPANLLLKNRAFLARLYIDEELTIRAIGRRINVAPSTVSDHLHRYGLIDEEQSPARKRATQVAFGYDLNNGKLVQNRKEQQAIRQMKQLRAAGLTYRDIAAHLNRKLVPTKRGGVWDHAQVRVILNRQTKKPLQQ